jgi:hypothetical protein
MDLATLQQDIALASMLISLGVTTVDKIKGYFAGKIDDDAVLAEIMLQVDQRIARRS